MSTYPTGAGTARGRRHALASTGRLPWPCETTLEREAVRQAVGRISVADAVAIATAASELGTSDARGGANVAPNRVLARALANPAGIGWRLTPADLRPIELAAMRGLVTRAYAAGRASR